MKITQRQLRQIIKEELQKMKMEEDYSDMEELDESDPMSDDEYSDYLQQRHGHFTSPQGMPGTDEYRRANKPAVPKMQRSPEYEPEFGPDEYIRRSFYSGY